MPLEVLEKKIYLPNGEKSPHIFLYEILCVSDVGNFPIFQMVSTKQDASMISYFFSEIIRDGVPIPRMVVSDFGKAILNAVARIFSGCSNLSHYLQICYNIIHNQYSHIILSCYIRLDVSHFISMIAKWNCLKGKPIKIRQFFLRCLAKAYQIENFIQLQNFMKSILVVTLSKEIGSNKSVLLQSEIHLQDINNKIKGVTIEDQPVEATYDSDKDIDILQEIDWTSWAEKIFHEALEIARTSSNGDVINAFYNIEAAEKIKSLMVYVPLWTNIMRSYFQNNRETVTSSFVEAEFAELKTRVFKNKLPMRIDKFIFYHIDYLDGRLKLACASNKKTVLNVTEETLTMENINDINKSDFSMTSIVHDYSESLNEIENWRSKIKLDTQSISKTTRQNYLTPCPDWDFIDSERAISIPIMKNGSLCNATMMNKEHIVVRETCAFDSIFQVIANGTGMRKNYKKNISELVFKNFFFKLIIDILKRGKIISNDYSTRATILCNIPIFKKKVWKLGARGISSLNANCNAAQLAEYLFQDVPSYTTSYNCLNCGHNYAKTSAICNINVDIILRNGLGSIQEAIYTNMKNTMVCSECKKHTNCVISYGPHLIFDTSIVTDDEYLNTINVEVNYILDNVAKNIVVENENYSLAGIVSYIRGSGKNDGHYIAFTYTGLIWYKYDDMASKRITVTATEEIYPHVMVYIKH